MFSLSSYTFRPKLVPTLATLFMLPILIGLGFWQVYRADYKRQLQTEYLNRPAASPVPFARLAASLGDTGVCLPAALPSSTSSSTTSSACNTKALKPLMQSFAYFPMEVTGHFDNDHVILIDNKIYHHRLGYQVVTPFWPVSSKVAILVNRGWMPQLSSKRVPSPIPAVHGLQHIKGIMQPPIRIFTLGSNVEEASAGAPIWAQWLDTSAVATKLQYPVYPIEILLNANEANGFVRDWQPVTTNPMISVGYAFQWFALACTLLAGFIVVSLRRK